MELFGLTLTDIQSISCILYMFAQVLVLTRQLDRTYGSMYNVQDKLVNVLGHQSKLMDRLMTLLSDENDDVVDDLEANKKNV